MFCSGCGIQIDSALNFCNRCGSPVSKGESASVAQNLSQAVGYVGGFGLLGFIALSAVLLRKGDVPMEAFVPIAFFYLAALVSICWLLIRHSSQLSRPTIDAGRKEKLSEPQYLSPRTTAQLEESTQMPASVIEHTTRTLDKTPLKR